MDDDWDNRTLWCGSLAPQVSEILLRELFVQGGPVEELTIAKDTDGQPRNFAFVTFKHAESVSYSISLLEGTQLFGHTLKLNRRSGTPVDDKYVNMMNQYYEQEHERRRRARRSQRGHYDRHNHYPYNNQCPRSNQYRQRNQHRQREEYPQRSWHMYR